MPRGSLAMVEDGVESLFGFLFLGGPFSHVAVPKASEQRTGSFSTTP